MGYDLEPTFLAGARNPAVRLPDDEQCALVSHAVIRRPSNALPVWQLAWSDSGYGMRRPVPFGGMSMDARSRARLGAFAQHARYDTRETTRAAREAFARRFEREVDPEDLLAAPERARRAEAAKRAYFQRMALRSAQARRKKATS